MRIEVSFTINPLARYVCRVKGYEATFVTAKRSRGTFAGVKGQVATFLSLDACVKGSSSRQKLQNSKGYTESPEFSPALGLIIFGKTSVATNLR